MNLLDLMRPLLLLLLLFLDALLESELAEVHDPAHRRATFGGDLDEVEAHHRRDVQGLLDGHGTHVSPFVVDENHRGHPDLGVYAVRPVVSFVQSKSIQVEEVGLSITLTIKPFAERGTRFVHVMPPDSSKPMILNSTQ